jgi:hypothetical protein
MYRPSCETFTGASTSLGTPTLWYNP